MMRRGTDWLMGIMQADRWGSSGRSSRRIWGDPSGDGHREKGSRANRLGRRKRPGRRVKGTGEKPGRWLLNRPGPREAEGSEGGRRRLLGVDGLYHQLAVHQAALFPRGAAQGPGGQAIDLAQGALGGLMQQSDGVGSKQVLIAAHAAQALEQILCGV